MAGRERVAGAGRSPYVLVLREHDDAGRGYALELAPFPGGDPGAPTRAHGHGSTGEAAMAAGAGTALQGHGGSPEAARGTSRAHGGSPRREAAAGTGAGTASRADGSSPTREAATGWPPRARGGSVASALFLTPRARGRGTAVEAGTGTPPRAHGGRTTSIGLPCGLHGTARCEKECSRHVGRFIYTLFSVLVIYGFYLVAMRIGDAPAPTPSPSLKEGDRTSGDSRNGEFPWALCFGMIGLFVLLGNLWSPVRGCCTGGDRDP